MVAYRKDKSLKQSFVRAIPSRNKSKTSASVWPGFPDTEEQMKARGRRPSAFIV